MLGACFSCSPTHREGILICPCQANIHSVLFPVDTNRPVLAPPAAQLPCVAIGVAAVIVNCPAIILNYLVVKRRNVFEGGSGDCLKCDLGNTTDGAVLNTHGLCAWIQWQVPDS